MARKASWRSGSTGSVDWLRQLLLHGWQCLVSGDGWAVSGRRRGHALDQTTGHFPDTQDQRNTLRTRFQYQLARRIWLAAGASYGSGLPFDYQGTEADALAEYGPAVISRINFDRGRIKPMLAVSASLGVDVYKGEKINTRLQLDGDNLNNRLNVIDFGGLFSGNAIGPGRSWALRLNTSF